MDSWGVEEWCVCLCQRRLWVISKASGPAPGAVGEQGGSRSREEGKERGVCVLAGGEGLLYQLLHITERRLFARQRSAAAGRQTHPLAAAWRTRLTEHIGLYLV